MNHVDRFVSNDELTGIISPDAIAKAGTYIVTLKCEGESFPESHQAHLVVGFIENTASGFDKSTRPYCPPMVDPNATRLLTGEEAP